MVLVGEIEQLAGDSTSLEGVEGGETLGLGDSIVQSAVDDEHWGLPVLDEVQRVLLFVAFWVVPGGAKVVPFGEPELIGVEVGHTLVDVAVVVD